MLTVYSIVRNICLDILSFGEGNLVFTTTKVYAKLMCQTSATPTTKKYKIMEEVVYAYESSILATRGILET